MAFTFSPGSSRYRDGKTGRFVKTDTVIEYSKECTAATAEVMAGYAQRAADGDMTPTAFRKAMRQEIKDEVIRQYVLGRGGVAQMEKKDWTKVGKATKEQYKYLTGFVGTIKAGGASVKAGEDAAAGWMARAKMYAGSCRALFEVGRSVALKVSGKFSEERWILGGKEHCEGCKDLAAKGWVSLGELPAPGDGSTPCLSNCDCHKEYK